MEDVSGLGVDCRNRVGSKTDGRLYDDGRLAK